MNTYVKDVEHLRARYGCNDPETCVWHSKYLTKPTYKEAHQNDTAPLPPAHAVVNIVCATCGPLHAQYVPAQTVTEYFVHCACIPFPYTVIVNTT